MPRADSPYNRHYMRARELLLASGPPCELRLVCSGVVADSADHDPPLSQHVHVEGSGCCVLRPACRPCQSRQGALIQKGVLPSKQPVPSREWL